MRGNNNTGKSQSTGLRTRQPLEARIVSLLNSGIRGAVFSQGGVCLLSKRWFQISNKVTGHHNVQVWARLPRPSRRPQLPGGRACHPSSTPFTPGILRWAGQGVLARRPQGAEVCCRPRSAASPLAASPPLPASSTRVLSSVLPVSPFSLSFIVKLTVNSFPGSLARKWRLPPLQETRGSLPLWPAVPHTWTLRSAPRLPPQDLPLISHLSLPPGSSS